MTESEHPNKNRPNKDRPYLGFGLGLRKEHYETILTEQPDIDWFEILTENYMVNGGKALYYLDKIRQDYPIVMHGVSMSLGSTDPLNKDYFNDLKKLIDRVQPAWISDHICWTGVNHKNMHDLLPLPLTLESADHLADRVAEAQDILGQQILLENSSTYLTFKSDDMTEWDYINHVVDKADCHLLLDVNNVYVSSFNHGFDPLEYLQAMPVERVYQHHLAGHSNEGNIIIDTHDHDVIDPVWDLYAKTAELLGPVSTMIERDGNIPPLADVIAELDQARKIAAPFYQR